jgi:uncharacterized protein
MSSLAVLLAAALWAGAQNALAGGGSFITLPALMFTGMDARAANISSTIALFPAQIVTGYAGRSAADGLPGLPLRALFAISLIGGAVGGAVLLATPSRFFAALVPWLVLFATAAFAAQALFPRRAGPPAGPHARWSVALAQFLIAVYGGYFGGGIGFLMMAALSLGGQGARAAGATKNVLAGVINAAAVALFVLSGEARWLQVVILALGASIGGWGGALLLQRINEKALRLAIVAIGALLTIGLFLRAP